MPLDEEADDDENDEEDKKEGSASGQDTEVDIDDDEDEWESYDEASECSSDYREIELRPDKDIRNCRFRDKIFTNAVIGLFGFLQSLESPNAPLICLTFVTTAPEDTNQFGLTDNAMDDMYNLFNTGPDEIIWGSSPLSLLHKAPLPAPSRVNEFNLRGCSAYWNITGTSIVEIASRFPNLELLYTEAYDTPDLLPLERISRRHGK